MVYAETSHSSRVWRRIPRCKAVAGHLLGVGLRRGSAGRCGGVASGAWADWLRGCVAAKHVVRANACGQEPIEPADIPERRQCE